jgi:predicted nucleic acid-binding protein
MRRQCPQLMAIPDLSALGRLGTGPALDAIVIATAVRHQAPVVTSDPRDLTHIADSIGVKIRLYTT